MATFLYVVNDIFFFCQNYIHIKLNYVLNVFYMFLFYGRQFIRRSRLLASTIKIYTDGSVAMAVVASDEHHNQTTRQKNN